MKMTGRASWIFGFFVAVCFLLPPLSTVLGHYHDPQQHYQAWHRHRPPLPPRRPVEIMTDAINDMGTRILQQYVEHGNVAFSPAGIGFILAALYEGSSGRSRQQIVDSLGLPRDRNAVRIGMRDIHRRLRTYLNPDGFLGGLNLNRENTTLRVEYESILRFYGFDLTIDLSNFTANSTNGNFGLKSSMTTTMSPATQAQTATMPPGSTVPPAGSTIPPGTVPTIPPGTVPTTIPPTTILPTTLPGTTVPAATAAAAAGATMVVNGVTTTPSPGTTTIDTSVVTVINTPAMTNPPTAPQTAGATAAGTTVAGTTAAVTTTAMPASANIQASTIPPTTTPAPTTMRVPTAMSPAVMSTIASLISTTLPRNTQTTQANQASLTGTTTTMASTTIMASTTMGNSGATASTTMPSTTTARLGALSASTTMPSTTTGADDIATVAAPTIIPALVRRRRSRNRRNSDQGYFTNYPDDGLWMQDLDIYADQPVLPTNVRDSTELQFLVNGCEVASVPAATYTAALPFAYFPTLKAAALEFPLDNPRYNVLLFLPTERVDTGRLARELAGQSLRLLRRQLQPTWVKATIPSFMLRGFVTLTPYLQRLGIRDVFEPRLADLGPMTPDLGVYARDVQQSIAVNIRNYMKEDGNAAGAPPVPPGGAGGAGSGGNMGGGNAGNGMGMGMPGMGMGMGMPQNPVEPEPPLFLPPRRDAYRYLRPANHLLDKFGLISFSAEHPFLYFIIDDETSVSLIAGRIDDPLNSRIQ